MKIKIKIILFLMFLCLLISNVSSTYSRYVSAANATVTTDFAKWQIFVDNTNISENYNTSLTFTPTIIQNDNVRDNKIAPGSRGYFDIEINPENVDVSFSYNIDINDVSESDVKDIKVTEYAILTPEEVNNDSISTTPYNGINIENTLLFNNAETDFKFDTFIIRVYFVWDESSTSTMTDVEDTIVGTKATNGEEINFELVANINFKQYI